MSCYLCGNKNHIEILNKQEISIWTNESDDVRNDNKYKCVVNQCTDCSHVYQPVEYELRDILKEIYLSEHAQVSTPMGKGNWGLQRARAFLNLVDLKKYDSIIEIGCGNGYLLKYLRSEGSKKLVGIEPSIEKTEEIDGILFLKDFANEKLKLPYKYDLIFSVGVFEHIEEINNVMVFCKNNLSENGELIISVPDEQIQLENGDPILFNHQHVNFYTKDSLRYLLSKHGFEIKNKLSKNGSLIITANISEDNDDFSPKIVFYRDYKEKLEEILIKVENILKNNNVIVHGACNTLNNILSWLNKDYDFTLVDNDETKQGKKYFNKTVHSVPDIDLSNYETLLIVPTSFFEVIKADYINKGFRGKIENILL